MLHFESYNLCHEQMQSISIILISTTHCHLCEDAERILQAVLSNPTFNQQQIYQHKVDVMDDDNLYQDYAIKIPVLQLTLKQELLGELYWPFDTNGLNQFLEQHLDSKI